MVNAARALQGRGSGLLRAHPVLLVFLVALLSRVLLLVLGHLWALTSQSAPPAGGGGFAQADGLRHGDVGWYERIRDDGYERRPFETSRQANWAFAPAWPYLWRAVDAVGPAIGGAVALNALLFAGACALLFDVLRGPLGARAAGTGVALLVALPGAQFTIRPGPESLFLFASVLAVWLAARPWPAWQIVLAAVLPVTVATLARPQGALVLLPVLWLLLHRSNADGRRLRGPAVARLVAAGAALTVPPVAAFVAFHLYLGSLTGNTLAAFQIQAAWDNGFAPPGLALADGFLRAFGQGVVFDYYGYNLLPLSVTLLLAALGLLVWGVRAGRLPAPLLAYALASVVVLLTRDTTQAANRFLLVIFPLFGLAGALLARRPGLALVIVWLLLPLQALSYVASLQGIPWSVT